MGEMKTAYDENSIPYLIEAEGSEAKHIVELLSAEANKRLFILPCNVGDKVYIRADTWGNTWNYKTILNGKYLVGEIVSIIKTKKQTLMKIQAEHNVAWKRERRRYTINAIGITVFFNLNECK